MLFIRLSAIGQLRLNPIAEFVILQSEPDRTDAETEWFPFRFAADHRIEDSEEC